MKVKLLLVFCASIMFACEARAGNHRATIIPGTGIANPKSDIGGGVIQADTKKPIGNVSVTAYSSTRKEKVVLTDGSGSYSLGDLKPGIYRLVFEKSGFKKVTKDKIIVRAEEGCQLNVEMDEEMEFQIMPGQMFSDFQ